MKTLFVKLLFFSFLLVSIFVFLLNPLFDGIEKNSFKKTINELYSTKKDSIDLLFFGSSHAMNTYNPIIIDETLGTYSYNLGSAAQKIETTKFLLEEVLKESSPKVVVLDVFYFIFQDSKNKKEKDFQLKVYNETKDSFHKLKSTFDIFDFNDTFSIFTPAIRNHSQWHELTFNKRSYPNYKTQRGYVRLSGVMNKNQRKKYKDFYTKDYRAHTEDLNSILTISQKESLIDVYKYLEAKSIRLIITTTPYLEALYNKTNQSFQWDIKRISDSLQIDYLDFNSMYNDLDLDFKDFKEHGHLNGAGSKKISVYLAKYLGTKGYFKIKNSKHINNVLGKIKKRNYEDNLKLVSEKNKNTIETIFEKGHFQNLLFEFQEDLVADKFISYDDGLEKHILIEIEIEKKEIWRDFLDNKVMGIHGVFHKRDYDKMPKYIVKSKKDRITWKSKPRLFSYNNKNYISFSFKSKTKATSFKKLRLFFMNSDKYRGSIGKVLEIENFNFDRH